ncbi:hypothetical protein [Desulfurella sp.]|uniref:hypothetical protein n=1 Tax=Desulfurella sp. TaxID=1962857 RepID=UPI0025C66A8B|nr:hypothetical protein [Desulfurella sp.]
MKWFCPNCWQQIERKTNKCPHCNYNLIEFEKISYEDKLILALKNPMRENRMFSIYMLGQISSTKAVKPYTSFPAQALIQLSFSILQKH